MATKASSRLYCDQQCDTTGFNSPSEQGSDLGPFAEGITLAPTGVVVFGGELAADNTCGPTDPDPQPTCGPTDPDPQSMCGTTGTGTAAWLDLSGNIVGTIRGSEVAPGMDGTQAVSNYGTAIGESVAFVLADKILTVDPLAPTASVHALGSEAPGPSVTAFLSPSASWTDFLLTPTRDQVLIIDARSLEPRAPTWAAGGGREILDLLIVPPEDAYVLTHAPTRSEQAPFELHRIDLAAGATVHRVPLPLPGLGPLNKTGGFFVPLGNGSLVIGHPAGHLAVLARASEGLRPQPTVDNAYPAVRERIRLQVPVPSAAASSIIVAWGDGAVEISDPDQADFEHSYTQERLYRASITATFNDGRTATTIVPINVGGTPPVEADSPTILDTIFAPENQEVTFFVLGLAATAAAGLIGALAYRRRRHRLRRELRALEEAFEMTRHDRREAARALSARRERARDLMLRGRLNEGQYAVLDARINELQHALREGAKRSLR